MAGGEGAFPGLQSSPAIFLQLAFLLSLTWGTALCRHRPCLRSTLPIARLIQAPGPALSLLARHLPA